MSPTTILTQKQAVFTSKIASRSQIRTQIKCSNTPQPLNWDRRTALLSTVGATLSLVTAPSAQAIQGSIAGRIPGVTGPDADGYYLYTRPEGKSGGHGVGWSEIPRYSFKIPAGWEETPVSIADLGGTEIDLRYSKDDEGSVMVIVAPIARFADIPFNANIKIDQLGQPDKIIAGFAPELFGAPLGEDDVLNTQVTTKKGLPYYSWELKPHRLVSATADGNRMFIITAQANSRQWRKSQAALRRIQESFFVPPVA